MQRAPEIILPALAKWPCVAWFLLGIEKPAVSISSVGPALSGTNPPVSSTLYYKHSRGMIEARSLIEGSGRLVFLLKPPTG